MFQHAHLDGRPADGEVAAPLHSPPPRRLHGRRRRALCRQLLPGGSARRESPPRRLDGGCRRTLALEGELCAEHAGRCLNLCAETDTIVQSHSIQCEQPKSARANSAGLSTEPGSEREVRLATGARVYALSLACSHKSTT